MTPEQITLIQESWAKVVPIADTASDIFYDRLFEVAPQVRSLFAEDMTTQKRALMGMITTVVNGLPKLETILPAVEALGARHSGYGAEPAHYDVVGAALLFTLGKGLGDAFTSDVEAAWTLAYGTLASVMKDAAAEAAAA